MPHHQALVRGALVAAVLILGAVAAADEPAGSAREPETAQQAQGPDARAGSRRTRSSTTRNWWHASIVCGRTSRISRGTAPCGNCWPSTSSTFRGISTRTDMCTWCTAIAICAALRSSCVTTMPCCSTGNRGWPCASSCTLRKRTHMESWIPRSCWPMWATR